MEYFVSFIGENISIRFVVRDGDVVGEGKETIKPGERFYYLSYEQLRFAGEGAFSLDEEKLESFLAELPQDFLKPPEA